MQPITVLYLAAIVFLFLALLFHVLGFYLLRCLHHEGRDDVQQIYIMNLCLVEILSILCFLVISLGDLIDNTLTIIHEFASIILLTVCSFVIYMNMMYIVLDKAVEVYWNIKYPIFWDMKKAKYLVMATWCCGLCICIGIIIAFVRARFQYQISLVKYFRPTLDVAVVVTVVVCYSYIFHKYRRSLEATLKVVGFQAATQTSTVQSVAPAPTNRRNWFKVFIKSRFVVSVCLVVTYLLFVVIPDIIHLLMKNNRNEELLNIVTIFLFAISYLCDSFVYILVEVKVKQLLIKKFRRLRPIFGNTQQVSGT